CLENVVLHPCSQISVINARPSSSNSGIGNPCVRMNSAITARIQFLICNQSVNSENTQRLLTPDSHHEQTR
ncbi:hypothetical protein L9F63_011232, partial [Diploptera punctata]